VNNMLNWVIFWDSIICTLFKTALSAAPQDSVVSKDAGIEHRTVATLALEVRRS
jgi:hypothetical protein